MVTTLIFAIGNESRGDDALAPLLLRRLQSENLERAELIEDYQLQIEHVTDLVGRNAVLFVDADVSCAAPFHFSEIAAAHDHSYTSHAMTPSALLYAYRQVYGTDAPPAFLLRIRGYDFALGSPLSAAASINLDAAMTGVRGWLSNRHGANSTPDHESACISRFPHPIPPPQAGNPHPIPLPDGEGSFVLSPSGGKMDRGLGANESLRDFHGN